MTILNINLLIATEASLLAEIEELEAACDDFNGDPYDNDSDGAWSNGFELGVRKGKLSIIQQLLSRSPLNFRI